MRHVYICEVCGLEVHARLNAWNLGDPRLRADDSTPTSDRPPRAARCVIDCSMLEPNAANLARLAAARDDRDA